MSTERKKVIIVGGHGKVALRLSKLISSSNDVFSVIRTADQDKDIQDVGAKPIHLSLEESSVSDFTNLFEGAYVVYFSAGAGGKGGEERTNAVDYEGALKVFDALEAVKGTKPRLILVSGVDLREKAENYPPHYNEADIAMSKRVRGAIPAWMKWKYEADSNLVKRTAFKWTILRPGGLRDIPGTGKASIGRTHITETISREDVAAALAALLHRDDASGLAIDIDGGDEDIPTGIDRVVKKGETDFPL